MIIIIFIWFVFFLGVDFKELWCYLCGRNNRRNCLFCLFFCYSLWIIGMFYIKGIIGDVLNFKVNLYFIIYINKEVRCLNVEFVIVSFICLFKILVYLLYLWLVVGVYLFLLVVNRLVYNISRGILFFIFFKCDVYFLD